MCIFVNSIILLMSTLTITNSERWYSAAIQQKNDAQYSLSDGDKYHFKYFQDSDHRFTPILPLDPKEWKNEHDVKSSLNTLKAITPNQSLIFNESAAIITRYNNTINNIRRITRPKRKHFCKRCTDKRSRKTKKLNSKQMQKSRFLEVFQVVEFDHESCTSSDGLEGTCLPEYKCINSGGSAMGICADGYGTCCVIQFRCNERSSAPVGWFTNPNFPSPSTETLSCAFTLDKSSEDIIQIRLDFHIFELLSPTNGICQDDQFIVSGQNVNNIIPILCGINTGQHIYIEVSDVDGPINLTFQTASPENRIFSIQVTQLIATDKLAATPGCLQYFKQPQGSMESFNYRDKSDIVITKIPSYFNNLNYAICIERAPASCSITYTNAGIMQIINYDIDGLPVIPPDQAGVEILNCPGDWLLIAATRLCGDRLNDGSIFQDFSMNAPIIDNSAGPIVVWFRSDESYVGSGFKLFYQQNSCSF